MLYDVYLYVYFMCTYDYLLNHKALLYLYIQCVPATVSQLGRGNQIVMDSTQPWERLPFSDEEYPPECWAMVAMVSHG